MCEVGIRGQGSGLRGRSIGAIVALLLFAASHSHAQQKLIGAAWQGDDLILHLSDSAAYAADIDESDTAHATVRIWGVRPVKGPVELSGPSGRSASIAHNPPNELLVTLSSATRFGCATLWRPYTNTLVVHTFRWEGLPYAQEQYYRALLAFEQNQPALAVSLLRGAHAAGEKRATSALGVWYARRGENALARLYLNTPASADEYRALAAVQLAAGDTAEAEASSQRAIPLEQALVDADALPKGGPGGVSQNAPDHAPPISSPSLLDTIKGWFRGDNLPIALIVSGGALLLLALIIVIVRGASRRRRREQAAATPPPSTPIHGVRVVTPEDALATPAVETRPATGITEETVIPPPTVETVTAPEITPPVVVTRTEPEVAVVESKVETVAPVDTSELSPAETATEVAPVVEEKSESEVPTAEEIEESRAVEEAPSAEVIEEVAPVEENAEPEVTAPVVAEAVAPESTVSSRSRQADELRRRIEAAQTAPAPAPAKAAPADPTIAEARRADLSRDAVALRRMLQREKGEER